MAGIVLDVIVLVMLEIVVMLTQKRQSLLL